MSSERRAAANGEAQEETPVLSDWLAGNLRVSRSQPPPAAPTANTGAQVAPPPGPAPVPQAQEAAPALEQFSTDLPDAAADALHDELDDEKPPPTPEQFSSVPPTPPREADASSESDLPGEDPDENPRDEQDAEGALMAAGLEPAAETPSTLAPQVIRADDEEDPAVLFLAQERRARRTQRIAAAAVVAALLLLGGGYLLSRRASDSPAEATETATATEPPAANAAKPEVPRPPDQVESPEPEAEQTEQARKIGLGATIGGPALPASAEPVPVPGGPSTARYPDLPRDVLIQLEQAAETTAP